MKKLIFSSMVLLLCLTTSCVKGTSAQQSPVVMTEQEMINYTIFDSIYGLVMYDSGEPIQQLVTEIALHFLGTAYVAGTLEKTPEALRVYLDKTDCILFVEMCTAFALTAKGLRINQATKDNEFYLNPKPSIKRAEPSYDLLCDNIRNMRYRKGQVEDYASRIHYTSEWILQNQTNGIVYEYTYELGEKIPLKFNYMSAHANQYKQLSDTAELRKIREMENHLTASGPYYYIPKAKLYDPKIAAKIQSGDIICFQSPQGQGIDIAHVALAYWVNKELHFIHASYNEKKVVVEVKTLADYANVGVRVIRINPTLSNFIAIPE